MVCGVSPLRSAEARMREIGEVRLHPREVPDNADLTRLGFVTRAQITQIMNLLNLAPDLQLRILLPRVESCPPNERQLRCVALLVDWHQQRRLWRSLLVSAGAAQVESTG